MRAKPRATPLLLVREAVTPALWSPGKAPGQAGAQTMPAPPGKGATTRHTYPCAAAQG